MGKSLVVLILISISAMASALAPAAETSLLARLNKLTSPHGTKVGLAFIDLRSGKELSINGAQAFPSASVAKVTVMAAAYHLADSGGLPLDQKVTFREKDKLGGAGVLQWLKGNRQYTLWNLMRLMITLSDNTATRLVVNTLGLPAVDTYIKSIGLPQTRVIDPTMLVEPPNPNNNLSSPNDMAKLLAQIYNRRGFSKESARQMIAWMNYQRYRWGIWRGVPPGTYVADKTGHLDGILNDVGLVYTKQGNYILSVFTCGFKKPREARLLINEVSRACYEEFTGQKLSRQPSVKSKQRSGRNVKVSDRKSRLSRPRSPARQRYQAAAPRPSRPGSRASKPRKVSLR
jgi:beta-lactamase class A